MDTKQEISIPGAFGYEYCYLILPVICQDLYLLNVPLSYFQNQ